MAQSTDTNPHISAARSLTDRLALLCQEEVDCLSRPPGKGQVRARFINPDEKIRTTGARTAGG